MFASIFALALKNLSGYPMDLFFYYFNMTVYRVFNSSVRSLVLIVFVIYTLIILFYLAKEAIRIGRFAWKWFIGIIPLSYTITFLGAFVLPYTIACFLFYGAFQLPDIGIIQMDTAWLKYTVNSAMLFVGAFCVFAVTSIGTALLHPCFTVANLWAAGLYNIFRSKKFAEHKDKIEPYLRNKHFEGSSPSPLDQFNRIGIILAGGGAKGAYQAGAIKAIIEFLDQHNCLNKIAMVGASSIGSWNSMFLLSDLVIGNDSKPGQLELWWKRISLKRVLRPVPYFLFNQNHLFSQDPWKEVFGAIFSKSVFRN